MNLINLIPNYLKNKIKEKLNIPNTQNSLQLIANQGFNPSTIVDIGAYHGEWTQEVYKIFPGSRYLMIEAIESKRAILKDIAEKSPNIDYYIALLGNQDGDKLPFHELETASSVLEEHFENSAQRNLKIAETLDSVLKKLDFPPPQFIKIDTQGYELEILKGGEFALSSADLVLLEVSVLDIHKNVPLINDVLEYMHKRNFLLYDIGDIIRRPLNNTLWQIDAFFCKEDSIFRKNKRWNN